MRHNEKSENIARGRRLLVVASQTVGVVAVHRPHRRPNPFISGQSLHCQMTGALGETMLILLSLTVRVLRREQIVTSATRRANREEKTGPGRGNKRKAPGLGSRVSFEAPTPHHRRAGVCSKFP